MRLKDQLRRHTRATGVLRMIVLPFEEYDAIEAARLERCSTAFAFEDPDTGAVRTVPTCAWSLYSRDMLRKIAEKEAARAEAAAP